MPAHKIPLEKRFWERVDKKGPDECWNWKGLIVRRYGQIKCEGRKLRSNRVAWWLTYGHPGDLCVLHKCDNPLCCNPNHLFLGTHKDNSDDKFAKKRERFYKGTELPQAQLTEEQIQTIRKSKGTQRSIGRKFGVTQSHVSNIKNKKCWKHL